MTLNKKLYLTRLKSAVIDKSVLHLRLQFAMNTEELTQIVTAHQSVLSRHDQEMAEIRQSLASAGQRLDNVGQRLEIFDERLDRLGERLDRLGDRLDGIGERLDTTVDRLVAVERTLDRVADQQEINMQAIAHLTASMQDLRNLVADYIRGRSQSE